MFYQVNWKINIKEFEKLIDSLNFSFFILTINKRKIILICLFKKRKVFR